MTTQTRDVHERWTSETEFFDRAARVAMASLESLEPRTLHRYGHMRRRHFLPEFRLRLLGDLRGRQLLDVGCGYGVNASIFAWLGAEVTGIDISPASIEVAAARAELNGVADRTRFVCAPLEAADFPADSFDVIWGDAVLHHLLADLDGVLARLAAWCRPGAVMMFTEPVNFCSALRRLRLRLPVAIDATPDERPLEPADVAVVRTHLPDLRLWHFHLLSRLNRFVIPDHKYETAPPMRRAAVGALACADTALLALPPLRPLAGRCVFFGRPRRAGARGPQSA